MQTNTGQQLFDLLVTRDFEPKMRDRRGQPVTDPNDADLFDFEWTSRPNEQGESRDYGTVVALLGPEQTLEIYYGDNLGRGMESQDRTQWYDFLEQMKQWAVRNMLAFELNNINRLKYTMQGMAAIKEGLFESYRGRGRISYSDQPQRTRIMIRHNRDLKLDEPRHRAIESIFVETADGERFRVPSRNLTHARLLARHVAEGGTPYDPFGQHITDMITEMATLSRFVRAARNRELSEAADHMTSEAIRHLADLKTKARRMISRRGYLEARDTWDPTAFADTELMTQNIREMFMDRSLDARIESALPILARLGEMSQVREFDDWTRDIAEQTEFTHQQISQLQELMNEPLVVGPDATEVTERLYDIMGRDQDLFAALQDLAAQDAEADARPVIREYFQQQGIDLPEPAEDQADQLPDPNLDTTPAAQPPLDQLPEPQNEDLDTDGVMMTRSSNMSSESRDWDLRRLKILAGR